MEKRIKGATRFTWKMAVKTECVYGLEQNMYVNL